MRLEVIRHASVLWSRCTGKAVRLPNAPFVTLRDEQCLHSCLEWRAIRYLANKIYACKHPISNVEDNRPRLYKKDPQLTQQSSVACFSVIASRNRYLLITLFSLTEESRSLILRIYKFTFPLCPAPYKPLPRSCFYAILPCLNWFLVIAELVFSYVLLVCIYDSLPRSLMFGRNERGIKAL